MSTFKTQAELQRWLLEEPGRRVQHDSGSPIIGYDDNGELWNFTDADMMLRLPSPHRWQPVPEPVPWHERPEAAGMLVWVWDGAGPPRLAVFRSFEDGNDSYPFKAVDGGITWNWQHAKPVTREELEGWLTQLEKLEEEVE